MVYSNQAKLLNKVGTENNKIPYKLSHTIPHKGLALCDSLAKLMRGFVLLVNKTITMKKIMIGLVLSLVLFPVLSFANFDVSVKYGSKGEAVKEVQDFLVDQGYLTGKIDGKFGFGTLRAVKAFQAANNLVADGYFGKASRTVAGTILVSLTQGSDAEEMADTGSISAPVVQSPTPKQVTDTGTQVQLQNINTTLNTIAQNTQNISHNTTPPLTAPTTPVYNPPMIETQEALKIVSTPLEGTIGGAPGRADFVAHNSIWIGTNIPSKAILTINGITYTSPSFEKDHVFREYSGSKVDYRGHPGKNSDLVTPVPGLSITDLNLDNSMTYEAYFQVVDENGNTISGYGTDTTTTIGIPVRNIDS